MPTTVAPVLEHREITIDRLSIHVVEGGDPDRPGILFLHGWPESSDAYTTVMEALAPQWRVAAIDLPGIGRSRGLPPSGRKRVLAPIIHQVISQLGLRTPVLVGHDAGGQIAYACLRMFGEELRGVAILNVVIPGLDPWQAVISNPAIWHFAFHAIPELPERLVTGHEAEYFDYFFEAIAASPTSVPEAARHRAVESYQRTESLTAGFDWYRAFKQDAEDNTDGTDEPMTTPLLYVRGGSERGLAIDRYIAGLLGAGVLNIRGEELPGSGHFLADEQPAALAVVLDAFVESCHAVAAS